MSNSLQLIVGLGNPGNEYAGTRHNAGALFVEELAHLHNISLKPDSKYFGLTGRGNIGGHDVRLLIPTTFMNRSGKAVATLASFFKIPIDAILVAHDELDIEPGKARFKKGGGHGGHNGLRDIISAMGNRKDFHRLRIGIGHPGSSDKVVGFVLNKAPQSEQRLIEDSILEATRNTPEALAGNWPIAMNRLHSFKA